MKTELEYKKILEETLEMGFEKGDRTGTGTISNFGPEFTHYFKTRNIDGKKYYSFPLFTSKKVHFLSIIYELLWFISGNTNTKYLTDNGVHIWNEWATEDGNLGPVYGKQWRRSEFIEQTDSFNDDGSIPSSGFSLVREIDQLQECIFLLKHNPDSRRIIVDSWNPSDLPDESISPQENVKNGKMALAPCHMMFQFYTRKMNFLERKTYFNDVLNVSINNPDDEIFDKYEVPVRKISLKMYQRSADSFLGVPFNVASYSALLLMVARSVNMEPEKVVFSFGDFHIYNNHIDAVNEMLSNKVLEEPYVYLNRKDSIDDYVYDDFNLIGYNHSGAISAPISV